MPKSDNGPDSVIGSTPNNTPKVNKATSMSSNEGVIGSSSAKTNTTAKKSSNEIVEGKVAIYSTKNVSWPEAGKINKGYNIVSESVANKWLTRDHVRLATPEEVKRELS